MSTETLSGLSDSELKQKIRNLKTNKLIDAALVGITVGIALYSVVKNGFGFFTFFPLILGYMIARNSPNNKILENELQKELASRKGK